MNILLISVQADFDVIGLKYIHYYLLNHGHNSTLLFLPNFKERDVNALKIICEFVEKLNPKLIGISLMSEQFFKAKNITQYLKNNFKSIPFVWGGVHPTIAPGMCLDYADYVCVGEGEKSILELVNAISNGKSVKRVKNLCYREGGKIKRNKLYPLIENLDEIPFYDCVPNRSYVQKRSGEIVYLNMKIFRKYARYGGRFYDIITSRGCPFSCSYCCNSFLSRLYGFYKVRRRSTENIISELEKAIRDNPKIAYINIHDDCFLACTSDFLREFCEVYKKKIGKPFIIRAIPTYISREKMMILKDSGLVWINVGLQSGSDRVCKSVYNRYLLKADFLRAVEIIKEFNVCGIYDVLVDNPFENEEDQFETINALMETPKPFAPQLYSLTFYFGTDIYERVKKEFPERMRAENPLKKDFLICQKSDVNTMIRLACFLNRNYMKRIIKLYRKNPVGLEFKSSFFFAKILSSFVLEPITYFRMLAMAEGGYFQAIKVFPMYFKENIRRYFCQFR